MGWGVGSWGATNARGIWGLGSPVPCVVSLEDGVVITEFLLLEMRTS